MMITMISIQKIKEDMLQLILILWRVLFVGVYLILIRS